MKKTLYFTTLLLLLYFPYCFPCCYSKYLANTEQSTEEKWDSYGLTQAIAQGNVQQVAFYIKEHRQLFTQDTLIQAIITAQQGTNAHLEVLTLLLRDLFSATLMHIISSQEISVYKDLKEFFESSSGIKLLSFFDNNLYLKGWWLHPKLGDSMKNYNNLLTGLVITSSTNAYHTFILLTRDISKSH